MPSLTPRPAELLVVDPSGHQTRVKLEPVPFRIGRQPSNQLVIRDSRTSRIHAQILRENMAYVLEDLKSRHGLFVNGNRVDRHVLRDGDSIEFGVADSFRLVFTEQGGTLSTMASGKEPELQLSDGGEDLSKLRAVLNVARAIQSSFSLDEVLVTVVRAALTITNAERGFLLMRVQGALEVRCALDRQGRRLKEDDLRVPLTFINRSLEKRRDLLSMVFDASNALPSETVTELQLRSAVCIPLLRLRQNDASATNVLSAANETAGVIYLDSRSMQKDLAAGSHELLHTLALEASTILENARLLEEERHKQKFEHELDLARQIQQSLLPATLPAKGWFRAAGASIASHQVGGDYYDVMHTGPDTWATVVADVAGKGVSSALLASLLQGAFLTVSDNPNKLSATMQRMNNVLHERTEGGKYATIFAALCHRDGRLQYINAGHCAPILVLPDGSLVDLETTAMPVGLVPDAEFPVEERRLPAGAKVVVFSDGVTEAEDADGRFFEKRKLRAVIQHNAQAGCIELQSAIRRALDEFTHRALQSDDITLVTFEYDPA